MLPNIFVFFQKIQANWVLGYGWGLSFVMLTWYRCELKIRSSSVCLTQDELFFMEDNYAAL